MRVPAVLQAAWRYREESVAWLLLNIAPDERAVRLTLDSPSMGSGRSSPWRLTAYQEGETSRELGRLSDRRTIDLTLPPRRPILIEARGS